MRRPRSGPEPRSRCPVAPSDHPRRRNALAHLDWLHRRRTLCCRSRHRRTDWRRTWCLPEEPPAFPADTQVACAVPAVSCAAQRLSDSIAGGGGGADVIDGPPASVAPGGGRWPSSLSSPQLVSRTLTNNAATGVARHARMLTVLMIHALRCHNLDWRQAGDDFPHSANGGSPVFVAGSVTPPSRRPPTAPGRRWRHRAPSPPPGPGAARHRPAVRRRWRPVCSRGALGAPR